MSAKINPIDTKNELLWQSRYAEPEYVIRHALQLLNKAEKAKYPGGMACARLNIAAASFYKSDNKTALKYLTEAFRWFEKNEKERNFVRALLIKGNIYESIGNYESTLNYWLEAYKISREIKDADGEGEASSQLGLIYSRLCNFPKSLEFFNRGLSIREKLGDENGAASSLNRIGMVLRQMKKYDESLNYYFRSLEIRRRNNQHAAIPWTLLGIASTYEEMGRYPEALEYFEQGLEGGDKRCSMQCMLGAGRVYSRMGDPVHAEERLENSLRMARELKSMVLISNAYESLASHYEMFRKPDKALKNFKLYLKSRESFESTEVQGKIRNIEVANAIEKSEQEKEIYRLRHVELKKAYDIIDEINRDMTASINYASRIQKALLPSVKEIPGLESSLFILHLPRDIVSGDFYWFTEINEKLILVAADCTGHGVPGALMSMLGISFLEEIITNRETTDSSQILDRLSREVRRALRQKGARDEAKDGMDIALCVIDRKAGSLQFSGAHNNLLLLRKGILAEIPADRIPIGYYDEPDKKFTSQTTDIIRGDMLYMFSDGFADQFGGPDNKKFKYSRLRELLTRISRRSLSSQKLALEKEFQKWKGDNSQTDDVLVIGYRI